MVEFNRDSMDARLSQKEVQAIYNSLSRVYDLWGVLTESRARRRALELADIKNGEKVLEVAVGTGLAFYEIVKNNPFGINLGIDISEGMLKKAQKKMNKISLVNYGLIKGSAFKIPIRSEYFDLIMNNYMFDLIPYADMVLILSEFKRVLKKDGRLVIVYMTEGKNFLSRIYDRIFQLFPRIAGGCRGIKLAEKLENAGFKVITQEYIQQMLFPSEILLAKRSDTF